MRSALRNGTRSRRVAALVVAAGLLFGSAACASDAGSTDSAVGGSQAGEVALGMIGSTRDEIQPYAPQNTVSALSLYSQLYDGLVRYNPDGTIRFDLAESMTANDGLDVWTVKLREGVALHNGDTFNADDLIQSLQDMLDPELAWPPSSQIAFVDPDGLVRVDDLTVEMNLLRPYGPVLEAFASDRIMLRSIRGTDASAPVGTGPFTLDALVPGQEATLTRFPDYWGVGPEFESLRLIFFQDQPAITNALRGGQIDIAYSTPFTELPALESDPSIDIIASDGAGYMVIDMRTDAEPFNDPRLREAMRLVVDRDEIVTNVFGGYATVANDFIGNNTPCAAPEVPQRAQDLERARELVVEAGADGLTVELVTDAAFPGMTEVSQLVAQQAAKVGITVEPRRLDVATFLNQWLEWPFVIAYTINPYVVTATNHFLPGGEENSTGFDDPEYNALADQLYSTADEDAQCEIITQLQQIEYERGGGLIPAYSQTITAYRDRVQGLQADMYGRTAWTLRGVSVAD